jgi:hypothetical protein
MLELQELQDFGLVMLAAGFMCSVVWCWLQLCCAGFMCSVVWCRVLF